jgi:transposase
MRLITILNKCHPLKSFVYKKARFVSDCRNEIQVEVVPRKNSKGLCPNCGIHCSGYDKLPRRSFEFIPFWGFLIFLVYVRRRINCINCGIIAEELPWAKGKNHLTNVYMQYLAHWAKKMSWKEVAVSFKTSWEKVFKSIEYVVSWGSVIFFL